MLPDHQSQSIIKQPIEKKHGLMSVSFLECHMIVSQFMFKSLIDSSIRQRTLTN